MDGLNRVGCWVCFGAPVVWLRGNIPDRGKGSFSNGCPGDRHRHPDRTAMGTRSRGADDLAPGRRICPNAAIGRVLGLAAADPGRTPEIRSGRSGSRIQISRLLCLVFGIRRFLFGLGIPFRGGPRLLALYQPPRPGAGGAFSEVMVSRLEGVSFQGDQRSFSKRNKNTTLSNRKGAYCP